MSTDTHSNNFFSVMVPVSSTVIPLPVYKVGYGLGFISKDKKTSFKPEDGIKLITSEYRKIYNTTHQTHTARYNPPKDVLQILIC